ncbi:hypothetical protein C3L33_16751, partial [Rhododendron williamsianum]
MMESQCFNPNAQVATQETHFTAMESISKKPQRGGNFTVEEDKLLVSAWLNISMDAVQGDDNVAPDNFVDLERPTGQKASKARIKECKSKLTDKKLEMLGKTYDQEQEKIRIKQELLEMKQFEADERVMMMDLNYLSEEQQEFYRLRRLEILEKRRVQ